MIFPQPVTYFDFPGMLAKFPKANVFMTPWGSESYRNGGDSASMRVKMEKQTIPLVMENDEMFSNLLRTGHPAPQFQPEDVAALRENYVHFWGPFWVAGKQIAPKQGTIASESLVPGNYTVEGTLVLDDRELTAGQVVRLERGLHSMQAIDTDARLVWGNHLAKPTAAPPPLPYWTLW